MQVYKFLEKSVKPSHFSKTVVPYDARADETMFMSNLSPLQGVDINWTGLGGKRTVCVYKPLLAIFLISNGVTLAGTLGNGNLVIDVVLNQQRMQLLEKELERLIVTGPSQTGIRSDTGSTWVRSKL